MATNTKPPDIAYAEVKNFTSADGNSPTGPVPADIIGAFRIQQTGESPVIPMHTAAPIRRNAGPAKRKQAQ